MNNYRVLQMIIISLTTFGLESCFEKFFNDLNVIFPLCSNRYAIINEYIGRFDWYSRKIMNRLLTINLRNTNNRIFHM